MRSLRIDAFVKYTNVNNCGSNMVSNMVRKILCVIFVAIFACSIGLPSAQPVYAGTATLYSNKDNFMQSGASAGTNNGTGSFVQIGNPDGTYVARGLVEFPITWGTDVPTGAVITSATLSLYGAGHPSYPTAGRTYWAYRVLRLDWAELGSTWSQYKSGIAWTTAGCWSDGNDYTSADAASAIVPAGSDWTDWNVLAQVQTAQTGSLQIAFMIKDGTEVHGHLHSYYSSDYGSNVPRLVIVYIVEPSVTTNAADDILTTSATLNGNIDDDGDDTITNYGFVWDTVSRGDPGNTAPTASAYANSWEMGIGVYAEGAIAHATGATLIVDTLYYCRVAALNAVGWSYGDEVVFNTVGIPSVSIEPADAIAITAQLNALITDDSGQACVVSFAWAQTSDGPFANWAAIIGAPSGNTDNATGTWTTGQYPYLDITGLTANTGYTFMARALNDAGLSYSTQTTFTTRILSISIQDASDVASTIAQLNALITDDIEEACVVSFAWAQTSDGPFANWAAIIGAPSGLSDNVTGTWITGQYPYLDIGSLTVTTGYTFMARAYNNTGTVYSSQETFTTSSGVGNISGFTAIPTSTTISIAWVKGDGASNTLIRYDISIYPAAVADGIFLYAGTGNSYLLEDLTEGTSYFFSGWGLTAGVYSDNATMVMATTLASLPVGAVLPTPDTPSSWTSEPSVAGITDVPFYALVNFFSDSYEIPNATMWYGLTIFLSVASGLFVFWRGNKNLLGAILTTLICLGIGAVLGLVYLWIGVFFAVIALAMAWLSQRY